MVMDEARRAGMAFAVLAALALPAEAQAPALAMLDNLSRGMWELRLRDGGPARLICVRTGRELIQLQHRQAGCTQFVVDDQPGSVTVQYTCRGDGYGRTTIRREDNTLVQIRSHGTQGGMPFALEGEARRISAC